MSRALRGTASATVVIVLLTACGGGSSNPSSTVAGPEERAAEAAVQANLLNALVTAKTYYAEHETYEGFNAAAGSSMEPSLVWTDGAGAAIGENAVSIDPGRDHLIDHRHQRGRIHGPDLLHRRQRPEAGRHPRPRRGLQRGGLRRPSRLVAQPGPPLAVLRGILGDVPVPPPRSGPAAQGVRAV